MERCGSTRAKVDAFPGPISPNSARGKPRAIGHVLAIAGTQVKTSRAPNLVAAQAFERWANNYNGIAIYGVSIWNILDASICEVSMETGIHH